MNLLKVLIGCLLITGCVPAEGRSDDNDNDISIHTHTIKCVKHDHYTCMEYKVFKVYKGS